MSIQTRVSAKHGGETAESAVIQRVDEIEHVDDVENPHIDARVTSAIDPRHRLPTVALPVVEIGTDVEIKSAMVVNGQDSRRGRFYLRQDQHEHLCKIGAVYLFAVCAPTPDRDVLACKVVPASLVDELVPSWIDAGDRANYGQITWSRLFDPAEIGRNAGDLQ